jgi:hypothetical protein
VNNISVNIDKLRSYANILSNSTFDKLVRLNDYKYLHLKLSKFDKDLISHTNFTYKEYFEHIFSTLQNNYRNEYVYKNFIINKILLGKYNLETTTAINEFKINTSIADLVLLNGTSKVFEIKTELDSPDRLDNQLKQYKKVFKEINLVTHHSIINKYLKKVSDDIGIIVLTNRFTLKTLREAKVNIDLDNSTIMKCLRKSEYSNIILKYFGELPSVTDFRFYKTCNDLICKIPSMVLHDMMLEEIKNRNLKERDLFSSSLIPKEIKHICLCLDFNKHEYKRLCEILSNKIVLK